MNALNPDVIVIGSGAGGAVAAYGLAMRGVKVLMIEYGPRFNPAKDYHADKPDWEFKDPFKKYLSDPYTSAVEPLDESFSHLSSTLGRGVSHREFSYQHACGVGGSTLRYQGEAHRFPPHAFKMKSLYDMGFDWPISYNDLDPYYEKVEYLLGVSGSEHPLFPRKKPYPNPAHPFGCSSRLVESGCKKLGITLSPNPLAILSRPYQGRPACIYCKLCTLGCMIGDKGSMDATLIPAAEKSGNLRIMSDTAALKVVMNKKGRAEGIIAADVKTKKQIRLKAKAVVLAAGAVETPRLLLNSANKSFPNGLLNANGIVGSYLMENIEVDLIFLFREKVRSYQGVAIDGKIWDFVTPKPEKGFNRAFALASCGAPDGVIGPASFALELAHGYGKRHRSFVQKYYGAHATVFGIAEKLPRETNRITLDKKEKDIFGLPKAHVNVSLEEGDYSVMEKMLELCTDIAKASGAERISGHYTAYDYPSTTHACGTARLGSDKKNSVVNSYGQAHAVKNIFVTDASLLVTQGCGASPSLTIQALALRASDYLADELRKGTI